jgi:uncharacterized protein
MIIDAYSHALHGKYLDKLGESGGEWTKSKIADEIQRAKRSPSMLDIPLRLKILDQNKVDFQVVTPTNYWDIDRFPGETSQRLKITVELNNNLARIMEDSRGRFIAIAGMTLLDFGREHLNEMDRAVNKLGMKGFCIQSNINGRGPDLPEFEAFWAEAERLDVPVFIHPQDPLSRNDRKYEDQYDLIHNFGWPYETGLALCRLVFSGIMERYPRLKVVGHHLGGGMIPFFWGRISETYAPEQQERTLGRVMPKPLFDYFSRFFFDTAVGGSASAIRCTYDIFGAGQLIFATDSPFGPKGGEGRLQTYPGVIKSLGLSERENSQIFEGNARRMLKLN